MSTHVAYRGKDLGAFRTDGRTNKDYFVANDLASLVVLLSLDENETVDIEGNPISYSKFKDVHLRDITGFYTSLNDWHLKNYRGHTPQEVEKELAENQ